MFDKGPLSEAPRVSKMLSLNLNRNKAQDQTEQMDRLAESFTYEECRSRYWQPPEYSLLYGTELWDQASETQRVQLNHLFWVAYYSQIISAEIATIHFNQTSATGLFAIEEFRTVCDTLDLESAQERAHIYCFKQIAEETERALLGTRLFTFPMRGPFVETMILQNAGRVQKFWKFLQLNAFGLLSANGAWLASQYFTIRGLRTLNGKLVQHQLAQFAQSFADLPDAPIPSQVSHYHFLDESFHFNSSRLISQDVSRCLPSPGWLDKRMTNMAIMGCQKDHYHVATTLNGLFWFDPAAFPIIYQLLRSRLFGLDHQEAKSMLWKCYGKENEGTAASFSSQSTAIESYQNYLSGMQHISRDNHELNRMRLNTPQKHLAVNRKALKRFFHQKNKGLFRPKQQGLPVATAPLKPKTLN